MTDDELVAIVEALLFASDGPATPETLAKAIGVEVAPVRRAIERLSREYGSGTRGLRLQEHKGGYQMVTDPKAAPYIEKFLGLNLSSRLSPAALEVLAIVAYRQPVTRAQIEAVRGVNSDGSLRALVLRGLVEEVGRLQTPGRPILYGTTDEFLRLFGLQSLEDLPPLDGAQSVQAETVEKGIGQMPLPLDGD